MISLTMSPTHVTWRDGDRIAGVYVLDDPFKPYLHPLYTPAGHCVTVAMPVDHRHHKGLMYALRCADLNFWEEDPNTDHCGIQRIETTRIDAANNVVTQHLHWCRQDGAMATYREQRTIRLVQDGPLAYVWTWSTDRTALRDHELIQSPWSAKLEDGRLINYHGLGMRLPWPWAFPDPRHHGVILDGQPATKASEAMGCKAASVQFWGSFDGRWKPDRGAVTMTQPHGFTCYVLDKPFAYLAAGPSNAGPLSVPAGQTFQESFTLRIEDLVA